MPIAFVRLPATLQQLAIGKTTLYARIAKGTFPPPVKFRRVLQIALLPSKADFIHLEGLCGATKST